MEIHGGIIVSRAPLIGGAPRKGDSAGQVMEMGRSLGFYLISIRRASIAAEAIATASSMRVIMEDISLGSK